MNLKEFKSGYNEGTCIPMFIAGKWMEIENIFLSEVSQVQKAKSYMWKIDLLQIQEYYEK
jgi:hypothetical protein